MGHNVRLPGVIAVDRQTRMTLIPNLSPVSLPDRDNVDRLVFARATMITVVGEKARKHHCNFSIGEVAVGG